MAMPYILVMVKHMLANKGFTMIEVIFVLGIVILLSMFTITFSLENRNTSSVEVEYAKIQSLLQEAKTIAITTHQRVDIEMEATSISYTTSNKQRRLTLAPLYYFDSIKDIYFNHNGNINQGNTIQLCNNKRCQSIVFNVGSGDFYLK